MQGMVYMRYGDAVYHFSFSFYCETMFQHQQWFALRFNLYTRRSPKQHSFGNTSMLFYYFNSDFFHYNAVSCHLLKVHCYYQQVSLQYPNHSSLLCSHLLRPSNRSGVKTQEVPSPWNRLLRHLGRKFILSSTILYILLWTPSSNSRSRMFGIVHFIRQYSIIY